MFIVTESLVIDEVFRLENFILNLETGHHAIDNKSLPQGRYHNTTVGNLLAQQCFFVGFNGKRNRIR